MGPITLRPYQQEGVDDIRSAFRHNRRALFVLSTGGGKTVIFSFIVASAIKKGSRVVIVAHRKEIVRQISQALTRMGVEHGLIMAGKTQTSDPVQVGMVQTLVKRIEKGTIAEPEMLVVDEAHHAVAGSWRNVTDAWSRCRILGVTATPERLDGKGLGDAFDVMVIGPTMGELIEAGHLAKYDYLAPPNAIDMSGVKTRGGDYAVDDLEQAMMASTIVGDSVAHYGRFLDGRPAIAFCVTRAHARSVAAQFCDAGWTAAAIDGSMSSVEREDLIASLADGRLNLLTSCELISEGVDVPVCAGAILLRPTKSLAMFLQQVGRVLRPKPDGGRAVILDHVGNVHRFGMPDLEREWVLEGKTKRDKDAGVTTCEVCFKTFPRGATRQLAEDCTGFDGDVCPFNDESESQKEPPQVVEGELQVVTDIRPSDPARPAWAGGLSIERGPTSGRAWFRLLDLADTEDKLREIANARGYKRGWVQHAMRARAETMAGVDAILTGDREHNDDSETWTNASDNVLWAVIRAVDAAEANPEGYPHFWPTVREFSRMELQRRRQRAVA